MRPSALNDAVSTEFDAIVARATAERVEDRYQSAVSLAAELRSLAAILDVRRGDREPPSLVSAKKSAGEQLFSTGAPPLAVLAPAAVAA